MIQFPDYIPNLRLVRRLNFGCPVLGLENSFKCSVFGTIYRVSLGLIKIVKLNFRDKICSMYCFGDMIVHILPLVKKLLFP